MKSAKDYLRDPYARIVIPDETGGFHAEILEFPGCFAQGDTVQDAYRNLEKAAEGWIDSCLSLGQEIPSPSGNLTFSGKISLRLPRGIHRQAAKMAEREHTSLNTYIVSAISARIGADDLYNLMAQRLQQQVVFSSFNQQIWNVHFNPEVSSASIANRPLKIQAGVFSTRNQALPSVSEAK